MTWNVATDLAINSIIGEMDLAGWGSTLEGDSILPSFALMPGRWPSKVDGREYTAEEKAAAPLGEIISKLPQNMSSEWYFDKIVNDMQEQGGSGGKGQGDGDIGSMDNHDFWSTVSDDQKEYVEGKIKSYIEKAVRHADGQASGWGNIPAQLREDIRASISTVVDWKRVVHQFVGSINRGSRTTSIKRINKRYPMIHPGTKRSYQAHLLMAIDMSGSVSNEMLTEFFAVLGSLTKRVNIDVLPFDSTADESDIFAWKKGQSIDPKRVRCGGTDFNAPTRVVNDPKNRGRWDGYLILTDGECAKPVATRIKRGWVVGKGHKLMFDTDEIQILMGNTSSTLKGAWRLDAPRPGDVDVRQAPTRSLRTRRVGHPDHSPLHCDAAAEAAHPVVGSRQ